MRKKNMYIISFMILFTFLSRMQAQNCTTGQYYDGECKPCGDNSYNTQDFTKCRCEDQYLRKFSEINDYQKPCYRLPGTPQNFIIKSKSSTNITFTWSIPKTNDLKLPTKYRLEQLTNCRLNNQQKIECEKIIWSRDIAGLEYTKEGLIPYTSYYVDLCSFNEATITSPGAPRDCTDKKLNFTTSKQAPGKIASFAAKLLKDDNVLLQFGRPEFMGSDQILFNIECSNVLNQTLMFTQENITDATLRSVTIDKQCGIKLLPCVIYASNEKGDGNKLKKTFAVDFPSCEVVDGSSSMSSETIVAIVLVMVLLIAMIFGGLLFYKWKKRQDKIDERWRQGIKEANRYTDNLVMPFRPRNLYVDALELTKEIKQLENKTLIDDEDCDYLVSIDTAFDYEFPRDKLDMKQRLGEGNFAVVYKAQADCICGSTGTSTVAVKILKDTADDKDKADFEEELALMKSVKPHSNLVRLLGCCTGRGNVAMVVEFLPLGDLLDVLRNSKKLSGPENFGKPYSIFSEEDFISFGCDIAAGMAHLAQNNIVHRDLACRNVLVGRNRECKIADLGLARFLDEDGIYLREKEAKLPIKWMSPEALWYGKASVKSDVWAFGITFWEVITIGASPYPGHKSKDVLSLLKSGYRMPKPSHCVQQLYDIMNDCWEESPLNRPSFEELRDTFKKLLTADEETNYMNFEAFDDQTYLSFDDVDDDITASDVQEETPKHEPMEISETKESKDVDRYNIV